MFGIGTQELILILIVALVVFGPRKLPEIGRILGRGLREFRHSLDDIKREIEIENLEDEINAKGHPPFPENDTK